MRWLLAIAPLLIISCDSASSGVGQSASSSVRSLYNGSTGNMIVNADGFLASAPEILYPEQFDVYIEREVEAISNVHPDQYHGFREIFRANGQGDFLLNVIERRLAGNSGYSPASSELHITYQDQQRYMVKYRDLHLGVQNGLSANFRWKEDPALKQMAGLDCILYSAESKHGLGDVDLYVDANTGMLLGYTYYDNVGEITLKLETTLVELSPTHPAVTWSSSLVDEEYYNPGANNIELDFDLSEPSYLPPGFYKRSARVLDSFDLFPGMGNTHVALYSDGIHQLFVAQHSYDEPTTVGASVLQTTITTARFSEAGGIRMVEGNPPHKRVYVVGQMPRDEIHTVFSSIFY
ncbi:MAG: hypothetical protein QGF46_03160 [Planctomycetota bacterium]|nr:hypothetical protein [Planctomycetota bacterium]